MKKKVMNVIEKTDMNASNMLRATLAKVRRKSKLICSAMKSLNERSISDAESAKNFCKCSCSLCMGISIDFITLSRSSLDSSSSLLNTSGRSSAHSPPMTVHISSRVVPAATARGMRCPRNRISERRDTIGRPMTASTADMMM